ncbi:hypothetical protein N7481_002286 [Penicillium waksmanii]|uniref:uncharacterized protein n=1 Tax=Penicillium waksmanii TaxID=69791 RepID=UPI002546B4DD|nr:uncharacterized protein N7481_002286 [Penicillium waksmanii]KAJ5995309.1 hypothetical protein N7481_002286 [Penicillium waksmanii]
MPGKFLQCEDVEIYHDLTPEDDDQCLWCWEDLLTASTDDPMPAFGSSDYFIEGLNSDIPPFELAAQFNPDTERGDSSDLGKSSSDEDEDEDEDDQIGHQRHT